MIKAINHVAIAVRDMDKAIEFFKYTYGAKLLWRKKFEEMEFESSVVAVNEAHFELLSSLKPGSMIDGFIVSRGEGIHHVSLEVDEFEQVINEFREKGLKIISENDTEEFKAAFIHPQSNFGVLTEIMQPK